MSHTFRIRLLDSANPLLPCFVARCGAVDGWRTQDATRARIYRTRQGAERFLRARPGVVAVVEAVA